MPSPEEVKAMEKTPTFDEKNMSLTLPKPSGPKTSNFRVLCDDVSDHSSDADSKNLS